VIVADASALFHVLSQAGAAEPAAARLLSGVEPVSAPHLADAEILSVLRRHVLVKKLAEARAREILRDYLGMAMTRLPHLPLLPRVFALRNTMTAYDALYVALAESLGARLVTRDGKLARAAARMVHVEVI
jgi:predicted nucleic acid-binding protein